MAQNTSTAVMQRRVAGTDHLDFYPTPPWATRALCEWIVTSRRHPDLSDLTAWDPACGEHDMVRPLREFFGSVAATDVAPHKGGHEVVDFLWPTEQRADWIITNPPFKLAEQFAVTALARAERGVALLVRTAFLEGVGRLSRLFAPEPPTDIFQFSERVVMHHGHLSKEGSTATAYCWVVWLKPLKGCVGTHFHWIAPCRKRLERDFDYPIDDVPPQA